MITPENRCPQCGSKNIEYKGLYPENPDMYLTEISPMWLANYKCRDCQNFCVSDDLLINQEEYLNFKRTKLIDKMLQ
jgi:DNA-directed RNA polymerase subunit RPC12/RpoP